MACSAKKGAHVPIGQDDVIVRIKDDCPAHHLIKGSEQAHLVCPCSQLRRRKGKFGALAFRDFYPGPFMISAAPEASRWVDPSPVTDPDHLAILAQHAEFKIKGVSFPGDVSPRTFAKPDLTFDRETSVTNRLRRSPEFIQRPTQIAGPTRAMQYRPFPDVYVKWAAVPTSPKLPGTVSGSTTSSTGGSLASSNRGGSSVLDKAGKGHLLDCQNAPARLSMANSGGSHIRTIGSHRNAGSTRRLVGHGPSDLMRELVGPCGSRPARIGHGRKAPQPSISES